MTLPHLTPFGRSSRHSYILAALPCLGLGLGWSHAALAQENTPPTITSMDSKTINEDETLSGLIFTVGDAQTAPGDLSVVVSSNNETLLPAGSLTLVKDGAKRTLKITPAANKFGQATIKLLVTDAGGLSRDTSFLLTVASVNDLPTVTTLADATIMAGTSNTQTFQIGDVETPASGLGVTGFSSNEALVPVANIVFSGDGANRTIVVTPLPGVTGTTKIYVRVADSDGGLAYASFNLTVTAPAETPALSTIAPVTIPENTGTDPLSFHISGFTGGISLVTVTANSSNLDLVTPNNILFSGLGADRTVTVTPRANRTGTATITLTAQKGDQTATTSFLLTVTETNSRPTAQSKTVTVTTGSLVTGQLTGTDPEGQALTFALVGQPHAGSATISSSGVFTYTPSSAFGADGDSFTFKVTDTGGLTSEPATVTVLASTDAPLVVTIKDDTVSDRDGKLSLREAITLANGRGVSTITFNLGRETSAQTLKVNATLPTITSNVTISNTARFPIIIAGGNKARLLRVGETGVLALRHMTLSGGSAGQNDLGGAVLSAGQLLLDGCTFIENTARQGGAVATTGAGATLRALNTTFAANRATLNGSALLNRSGVSVLINCTVVGARGTTVPLLVNDEGGTFSVWNTILDGVGGVTILNGSSSTFTSRGHNLATDGAGGLLTGSGDIVNKASLLDTLRALKYDPVSTYALKAGSPARNGGDSAVYSAPTELRQDARYANRWQSFAVDMGAVEMTNAVPSGSFASKEKGFVGTPLTFTTSWSDEDGAADIAAAQVYFATSPNAQKTGPVLRLVRSNTGFRLYFVDGGVTGTNLVDLTEAAAAGTASTGWFTNLSYTLTSEAGTLTARWKFTPTAALVGERKAYLSVVDSSGAGGLGLGAPFGSLKVTQSKPTGTGANTASAPSVKVS